MGKNLQHQDHPSNIPLQNDNQRCAYNIFHVLHRRHKWHNVRKTLPNKRQGTGKHIIDQEPSAPAAIDSSQPEEHVDQKPNTSKRQGSGKHDIDREPSIPSVTNTSQSEEHSDPKKNDPRTEKEANEPPGSSVSSKSSMRSRIRALISDEMSKRRGKQHRQSSSSSKRLPSQRSNSIPKPEPPPEDGPTEKTATLVTQSNSESPSLSKKRKCDICAAMLTVSYLRRKGPVDEHQKHLIHEENIEKRQQNLANDPASFSQIEQASDGHDTHHLHSDVELNPRVGLTKSFSFPLHGSTKKRDYDIDELKSKLRECKDIETCKEQFILPLNQIKYIEPPKPMLTRPESFKNPSPNSQNENKPTTNHFKNLRQKLGGVIKEGKKEKSRILRDAVFHKIPYGRKSNSKDVKAEKGKVRNYSHGISGGSDQASADKTDAKKTASSTEALSKYRWLLKRTSNRDEKCQLSDKSKLSVAESRSSGGSERRTLRRVHSLPDISPLDFMHDDESPVKMPIGGITLSVAGRNHDDQKSPDHHIAEKQTESNAAKETAVDKDEAIDENLEMGQNTFNRQKQIDHQKQSNATMEATVDKDEAIDENLEMGRNTFDHKKQIDHQKQSNAAKEIAVHKDEAFDGNRGVFQATFDHQNQNDHKKQSNAAMEIAVHEDEAFDESHGGLQTTFDHQENIDHPNEFSVAVKSVAKGKNTKDPQEEMEPTLSTGASDKWLRQHYSSSPIDIPDTTPDSAFEDSSSENEQYQLSMDDECTGLSVFDDKKMKIGFLHLELESVKNNVEFQYVKEVLERSGFMECDFLEWYSSYQPIDPLLFEEVEVNFLQKKNPDVLDSMEDEEVARKIINDHHLLLFDLINEALLEVHNKSFTYCPKPLTYRSKVHPMPVGCRVLEEVWDIVNVYLSWKPEQQPSLDDAVSRDLAKGDGWMNLQANAEFVGIELEEMLTEDLLDELVFDDLLM